MSRVGMYQTPIKIYSIVMRQAKKLIKLNNAFKPHAQTLTKFNVNNSNRKRH
jgi:hypothetical protein